MAETKTKLRNRLDQGRRNISRAGEWGEVKMLRAMETYEKQKNRHQ